MSLLKVQNSKKIQVVCSLEESTSFQLNHYAVFLGSTSEQPISGDVIVDEALQYVFAKDKKFRDYMEAHGNEKAPAALKVKTPVAAPTKAKGQRKQPIAIAQ